MCLIDDRHKFHCEKMKLTKRGKIAKRQHLKCCKSILELNEYLVTHPEQGDDILIARMKRAYPDYDRPTERGRVYELWHGPVWIENQAPYCLEIIRIECSCRLFFVVKRFDLIDWIDGMVRRDFPNVTNRIWKQDGEEVYHVYYPTVWFDLALQCGMYVRSLCWSVRLEVDMDVYPTFIRPRTYLLLPGSCYRVKDQDVRRLLPIHPSSVAEDAWNSAPKRRWMDSRVVA